MFDKKKYIEFISLKGGDEFACLKLFTDTSLRDTAYVKVCVIDELLKFGLTDEKPMLRHKVYADNNKSWNFKVKDWSECISLDDLMKDDTAMAEYVKHYFPEYKI